MSHEPIGALDQAKDPDLDQEAVRTKRAAQGLYQKTYEHTHF
jgi:hypothetical protein